MRTGGAMLRRAVDALIPFIQPGISLIDVDHRATELITTEGAGLSFARVPGYRWATCLSVNETVVHGVPDQYRLKAGDVLKLDIGVFYKGFHVDYGDTLIIGGEHTASSETKRFLDVGRKTLSGALALVQPGVHIGVVSEYIGKHIEGAGYKIIYELTGHAVGTELHMTHYIPGFLQSSITKTPLFKPGTAYAIEVIYSERDTAVVQKKRDGWSLETEGGSQSGCFENSVFVDQDKAYILV